MPKEKPPLKIPMTSPTFGSDPEFFFKDKEGAIVPSERVLPAEGKLDVPYDPDVPPTAYYKSHVICEWGMDGVQVELRKFSGVTCRAHVCQPMKKAFKTLDNYLRKQNKGYELCMEQLVHIPKETMKGLGKSSRVLGCEPSFNIHDKDAVPGVDGETYLTRSAGGHVHLGCQLKKLIVPNTVGKFVDIPVEHVILAADAVLGNTAVLLDRDPGQVERRKVYGRAGEFRTPKHGLEYRTLSNFWMRSPQLVYFATGMMRFAYSLAYITHVGNVGGQAWDNYGINYDTPHAEKWDALEALFKRVDPAKCRRAINENNFDLAMENYQGFRAFLEEHMPYPVRGHTSMYSTHPLDGTNVEDFEYLVEKGIEHWFPKDKTMETWLNSPNDMHSHGWEAWLHKVVKQSREGKEKRAAARKSA